VVVFQGLKTLVLPETIMLMLLEIMHKIWMTEMEPTRGNDLALVPL
jgi:hypothetical protein